MTGTIPLGQLLDITSGFAFSSTNFNSANGVPLIRIRDLARGMTDLRYDGEYDPRFLVQDGDLLIGMDGEFRIFEWQGGPALLNQRVCRVEPKCGALDPRYLLHFLPTKLMEIEDRTPFVTVKHLSAKSIKAVEIPDLTLAEQRRIASILDKADAIRRKREKALALADDFLRSVFLEMFDDQKWPIVPLAEAVAAGTIVTYGIVQAGPEIDGGIPYIRTGDIKNGEIVIDGLRHTSPKVASKFTRSRVRAGEIVMSIRATVGTTAIVPPELDGANLTQGTARIAPGGNTTLEYLLSHLRSQSAQTWIEGQVKGATFREITLTRLRELPVPIPPIDLQQRYSLIYQKNRNAWKRLIDDATYASDLSAALSQRAFRGEL